MDSINKCKAAQIKKQKQLLLNGKTDISLSAILNSNSCQRMLNECHDYRERIYTPFKTLFTFIKQVLSPDKSCKKAVSSVAAERLNAGHTRISLNTGPYCKARKRIPEKPVQELVKEVSKLATKKALNQWKLNGRNLKVFDGSTVKMPDTKENQQAFPQHKNQKKGVGFPILRFVVIMSLTVGTVINYAVSGCKGKGTGESSLLRSILSSIEEGDIVLGDRYFPSFFLMADLKNIGADGIFRGQSMRRYDFRTGSRLGKKDHVVNWKKPQKPEWMNREEYDLYPEEVSIREFKVNGKVYVTTFLNSKSYHKKELAKIYKRRWEVEISLNSLKTVMNMDMLSCKTPDMVKKEIGIHFLAYNFIRIIMADSCIKGDAKPWQISFKGSIQLINEFMPYFLCSTTRNEIMYSELLKLIVQNKIGNRPGRVEPRALKQRRKDFPMLNRPRSMEKMRLIRKIQSTTLNSFSLR
jgi:hypothetical protein